MQKEERKDRIYLSQDQRVGSSASFSQHQRISTNPWATTSSRSRRRTQTQRLVPSVIIIISYGAPRLIITLFIVGVGSPKVAGKPAVL
jgi:hypothetical protein